MSLPSFVVCKACKAEFPVNLSNVPISKDVGFKCSKCGEINKITLTSAEPVDPTILIKKSKITNEVAVSKVVLKLGNNVFGRGDQNSENVICLTKSEKAMSRKHFEIEAKKSEHNEMVEYTITDLKSTNGIILNGNRLNPLSKVYLNDNDVITIGQTHILFQLLKI
jgi:predicted Zn finger-like uncharacterized protein